MGAALKIGAYLPSHRNPVFLRLALLQLESQTRVPDVIAVYENNQAKSGWWAAKEIAERLKSRGVTIIHEHVQSSPHPDMHLQSLKRLYEEGCDIFFKIDHDDLYFENHIEKLVGWLGDHEYVINQAMMMVICPCNSDFTFQFSGSFPPHPLGGMSNASCFNREFAAKYIADMEANPGKVEDAIIYDYTVPRSDTIKVRKMPTVCYVVHGSNSSTQDWYLADWARKNMDKIMPQEYLEQWVRDNLGRFQTEDVYLNWARKNIEKVLFNDGNSNRGSSAGSSNGAERVPDQA